MSTATPYIINKFHLTDTAVSILRGKPELRNQIALALGIKERAVRRYVNLNDPNNELTKQAAIDLIVLATSLTEDQILETREYTIEPEAKAEEKTEA